MINQQCQLKIMDKEFYLFKDALKILNVQADEIKFLIGIGMAWLFLKGNTYICPRDYMDMENEDLIEYKANMRIYNAAGSYGSRYNVNEPSVKELYNKFKKWKGYDEKHILTYMEQIEFDCYMDKYVSKVLKSAKKYT